MSVILPLTSALIAGGINYYHQAKEIKGFPSGLAVYSGKYQVNPNDIEVDWKCNRTQAWGSHVFPKLKIDAKIAESKKTDLPLYNMLIKIKKDIQLGLRKGKFAHVEELKKPSINFRSVFKTAAIGLVIGLGIKAYNLYNAKPSPQKSPTS